MRNLQEQKRILPEFPRTPVLPYHPNPQIGDTIASEDESHIVFQGHDVWVENKLDGSLVGFAVLDGHPVIRNRNHILSKGFLKDTPAKKQFRSIWDWYYKNQDKFKALGDYSVYGELMVMQHGLEYDQLPDWVIPFDLYDPTIGKFLDTGLARKRLQDAGFVIPPLLMTNPEYMDDLYNLCQEPSEFTTKGQREGVYIKVCDGKSVIARFKMIRQGFVQGALFCDEMLKNKLRK